MPRQARSALSLNPRWIILSIATLAASFPANADFHGFLDTGGRFTQIDVPRASSTFANSINNAGQIVGNFTDSANGGHGFLDTGGSFTQIDVPGATSTSAQGINGAGQIVGYFFDGPNASHSFLDTGGSFTQIDVPGAPLTRAYGINDAGQIVGDFGEFRGALHGFLDTGGSFIQIDVPGATFTSAQGINGAGQIVGYFVDSRGAFHGFLDTVGSFTQIDVPAATLTSAQDINDAGQIVGFSRGSTDHGFLDTGGSFTQIDAPGAFLTEAYGINNAGQIVGNFASATGDPHFITYSGMRYDYQGIGDFLLTRSTVPGDQFDVQVRTRSVYDDAAVTIMSEAAATLCNHRITFGIDRASTGGSFVWLDGSPSSLSADNPVLTLGTCKIDELSPEHYQVVWDTGEILDVTNNGTYLDLSSQLSWIDGLGSMEGLLSSDFNPDAWRVIGAASLFAPVPEPGTLTLLASALAGLGIIRRRAISAKPR
jgi:uncharacterized membrane protein